MRYKSKFKYNITHKKYIKKGTIVDIKGIIKDQVIIDINGVDIWISITTFQFTFEEVEEYGKRLEESWKEMIDIHRMNSYGHIIT